MTLAFDALFDSLDRDIAESLAWRGEGHCVGMDRALFFPDRGQRGSDSANRAKLACLGCPVQRDCLVDALERKDRHGVWGGTTERERRVLLRDVAGGESIASVAERTIPRPFVGWVPTSKASERYAMALLLRSVRRQAGSVAA